MQSRLIDINTAAIKHRNEVMSSLKSGNYDSVFGALYAMNALLPETLEEEGDNKGKPKYRVIISDMEYKQATKPQTNIICPECNESTNFDEIKVFDALMPMIDQCITRQKTQKMWFCPKCEKSQKIELSQKKETSLKEPYYLGIIPKPPLRHEGLQDRSRYRRKVTQWAWNFLDELEAKFAQFRDDNWNADKDEEEDFGFNDDDVFGEDEI